MTGAVDACFIVKSGPTVYSPTAASFGGTVEPDGRPPAGSRRSTARPVRCLALSRGEARRRRADPHGGRRHDHRRPGRQSAGVQQQDRRARVQGADAAARWLAASSRTKPVAGNSVAFAAGNVSRNAFGALGLPSVVIMALNTGASPSAAAARRTSMAGAGRRQSGERPQALPAGLRLLPRAGRQPHRRSQAGQSQVPPRSGGHGELHQESEGADAEA